MIKNKEKVIVISGVSSIDGGSNAAMIENIIHLRNQFEFLVIVPTEGTLTQKLNENFIPFEVINSSLWRHSMKRKEWKIHRIKRVIVNLLADFKIYKILRKKDYSIVHINVSAIGIGWLPAKILNIPVIWHLRELNDIDQNYPLDFPKIAAFMFDKSHMISISQFVYDYYKNILSDVSELHLIRDGISVDELARIENLKIEHNVTLRLGFMGGYQLHKGLDTTLEALHLLRVKVPSINIQLDVYGSQYEQNVRKYQELAQQFGIESLVTFHGFASELVDVYSSLDVVISAGLEAFGRVVAETITSGRISLGANQGATPELIKDGKNGYIFNHQDAESLAEKILAIIDNWDYLINSINKNRDDSIEEFSSQKTANELGLMYKRVIEGKKNE